VLTHVIEHVEDPIPFLKSAARVLSPDGEIILSTPNLNCLWAKILGPRWWIYAIEDHFSFFTAEHFSIACKDMGFSRPKVWTENMNTFHTIYRAFRPVKIDVKSKSNSKKISPSRLKLILANSISFCLEVISRPWSWFGMGFEIIAIMRKENNKIN
jgi:SAM-dependent methyltransferase